MANFYKFAEEAIEMAGEAGERKRKHALTMQQKGARSRLAELERSETGATRRQAMIEAGKEAQHKREYERPRGVRPEAQRRGGLAAAGTRMKSFDFANKAMSEMYPERINPVTNEPFTPEAWEKRVTEIADRREAYGGVLPTEEQPAGMQGRGRVVTESGELYDITPGGEGYSRSMASPMMMETAGFPPRVPANRSAQMAAGVEPLPGIPEVSPFGTGSFPELLPKPAKDKGQFGIPAAYKAPLAAARRSFTKPIKRYTPRSYMQLFGTGNR